MPESRWDPIRLRQLSIPPKARLLPPSLSATKTLHSERRSTGVVAVAVKEGVAAVVVAIQLMAGVVPALLRTHSYFALLIG